MSRLKLSIATTDYDHFRDFRLGTVQAEGIETNWSMLGHHEIFARFTFNREWDAAELSFAKFMRPGDAQGLRHHRPAGGLLAAVPLLVVLRQQEEQDQDARRTSRARSVGSPEWAHTAAVYMRGWLNDEHGVGLKDIHWFQAGANEAGRDREGRAEPAQGRQAHARAGQVAERDAGGGRDRLRASSRGRRTASGNGHPDVVRLFPDFWAMEEKYYKATGSGRSCTSSRCKSACSTKTRGWRAISTTPSSPPRTAASSG